MSSLYTRRALSRTNDCPVKVRFQNPHIASKYRSTVHAFFTIVREERIRGLYRGIAAPLVRLYPLSLPARFNASSGLF